MTGRRLAAWGAVLAGLAVAAGAFGAHALRDAVTPERLDVWRTAATYQLVHGIALVALGAWQARLKAGDALRWLRRAGLFMVFGVVVFSGTLYLLVGTDTGWLGAITPVGGSSLIAAWGLMAWALFARGSGGDF